MDPAEDFKKQQTRNNNFSFQRKFRGLGKEAVQLVEKADKVIPTKYLVLAIIYFAIVVGIYMYATS